MSARAAWQDTIRSHWLLAPAGRREALWLAVSLALLSCLPVLVAARPQMTDFPSHLARYHVMLDGGASEWLQRYYGFTWRWSGNLGADLLIWPLAKLFGLEGAARLIAGIIPPLTGLSMIAVEWTLRRRIGVGTMLAFATIWSPALVIGFLNFSMAFAFALLAFALWVKLENWRWRWLVMIPAAWLVWLCHLAGWGVLGVLVFGYDWNRQRSLKAVFAPWPLVFPGLTLLVGAGGPLGLLANAENVARFKQLIWRMALRDRDWTLDASSGRGRLYRLPADCRGAERGVPGDRLGPAARDPVVFGPALCCAPRRDRERLGCRIARCRGDAARTRSCPARRAYRRRSCHRYGRLEDRHIPACAELCDCSPRRLGQQPFRRAWGAHAADARRRAGLSGPLAAHSPPPRRAA
jgi:hypothetical protein